MTDQGEQAPESAPGAATDLVIPTQDDPDIARGSTVLGGPIGSRGLPGRSWWTPLQVSVVVAVLAYMLSLAIRIPCVNTGFGGLTRYTHMCYSDIPVLYSLRGFADGYLPYLEVGPGQQAFEYPVLTGAMAQLAAWATGWFGGGGLGFYAANVTLIGVLFIVTVVATGASARPRKWDAVLVATAPAIILTATINWDMLPVALVAVSLLLWSRRVVFWAGVVLGLAVAAKFYPLVLLGPLLVLCFRAGRMGAFGRLLAGAVLAWLVANVPVMLVNFKGWSTFYTFSEGRGQDFGSPWLALSIAGVDVPAPVVNPLALGIFLLACLALTGFMLKAPLLPRVAPMMFLVLAAFLLTNKVYSPQYVMWLVPLAVLARPRLRDLLIWQTGEIIYYAAVWLYLAGLEAPNRGLPAGWYSLAIWIHIGVTVWFAALLLRDAWWPERDSVRRNGIIDPLGGPLNDDHVAAGNRAAATVRQSPAAE